MPEWGLILLPFLFAICFRGKNNVCTQGLASHLKTGQILDINKKDRRFWGIKISFKRRLVFAKQLD
jgi:hypothetical protein